MMESETTERPRPWAERHAIALFLAVTFIGFDLWMISRLHAELFFFGMLQVPVALLTVLACVGLRKRTATWLALLVAGFPFCSGPFEDAAILARAHYAGVSQVVREGRELSRRFREEPHAKGDEHGHPILEDSPELPPAIRKLGPGYAWPEEDGVEIKMYGMGTWTGYVVLDSDDATPPGTAYVKRKLAPGLWWVDRD